MASTTATTNDNTSEMTIVQMDPALLTLPESTDVRPWEDPDAEVEVNRIKALAETIKQDGQLQPVLARMIEDENGDTVYELIAGRRRKAAIEYLNANGKRQYAINVSLIEGADDDEAFRKAMVENTHRQNPSPMDQALNIKAITERFEWTGTDYASKVGKFLNVSAATVRQSMKLLELPLEIQEKLHAGTLTQQAAWDLLAVKPEKRQEVLAQAAEVATAEAVSEKAAVEATGKKSRKTETGSKVKGKHIQAAARKIEDALTKAKPLSKSEIIDWFDAQDGPANGHANGAVRMFVRYFVDVYCKGSGTDRMLNKHWNRLIAQADMGTEEEMVAPKAVKGRVKAVGKKSQVSAA